MKAPESWDVAYYHCVSRVVDRRLAFDGDDKRHFVKLMRFYEKVCQVRLVTYCVMSNHFHLLVEVPARPEVMPTEEELIAHIQRCYGKNRAWLVEQDIKQCRARGNVQGAQQIIDGWLERMWDVSAFMKTLKQRFTQWHNKRYERKGTLWEDRFHSTIVEGRMSALAIVGAYIDLNPIRAGLVKDPKEYLWSGYGAAVGGDKQAVQGMEKMVEPLEKGTSKGVKALEVYRMALHGEANVGNETSQAMAAGVPGMRRGVGHKQVEEVRRKEGKLTRWEMLRCRVRYFTAGAVIGSRGFVNEVFAARREYFGPKRTDGARPLRGADFGDLCALRDLRVNVIAG
jgi:REP element-mobilizing transposase RayT